MKIISLGTGYALTKKGKIVMITDNHDEAVKLQNLRKKAKKLLKKYR